MMIYAAIYNIQTGKICHRIGVPIDQLDLQPGIDEEYYINCPGDATHINLNTFEPERVEEIIPLEKVKAGKRLQLSWDFNSSLSNGKVISSLGFEIDARRSGTKNDMQNMESLLKFMETNNIPTTTITDANDIDHENITQDQIKILINEIQGYGLSLYSEKRAKVMALNAATTKEEVEAI